MPQPHRARAHSSIHASHQIGDGATNTLAAVECREAVVGLSSRLDKPFVLGLIALLERLDARRKHVLDGGETTGIDLPLRVAGYVLR